MPLTLPDERQTVLVCQQNRSAEAKIAGIRRHAGRRIHLVRHDVDQALPLVVDDARPFLPPQIRADLVLDFLTHPDLSHDLAGLCQALKIPLVASGKKRPWAFTPPT
jgi:hypothetical protein